MMRIPVDMSIRLAVAERLARGREGAWKEESYSNSGRGYDDGCGHGVGIYPGQGYSGGGGLGSPPSADVYYHRHNETDTTF